MYTTEAISSLYHLGTVLLSLRRTDGSPNAEELATRLFFSDDEFWRFYLSFA